MFTTIYAYAEAAQIVPSSTSRRLKGIPYLSRSRGDVLPGDPARVGRAVNWYPLAAVVQTLRKDELDAIPALVEGAKELHPGDSYVDPRFYYLATPFIRWCGQDMRSRARRAQNDFVVAVANSKVCSPAIVKNLTALREIFVLHPDVTRWILVGGLAPDLAALAPSFAVANNSPSLEEFNLTMELAT